MKTAPLFLCTALLCSPAIAEPMPKDAWCPPERTAQECATRERLPNVEKQMRELMKTQDEQEKKRREAAEKRLRANERKTYKNLKDNGCDPKTQQCD